MQVTDSTAKTNPTKSSRLDTSAVSAHLTVSLKGRSERVRRQVASVPREGEEPRWNLNVGSQRFPDHTFETHSRAAGGKFGVGHFVQLLEV